MEHHVDIGKRGVVLLNTFLFLCIFILIIVVGKEVVVRKQQVREQYGNISHIEPTVVQQQPVKFSVDKDVHWKTLKGEIYPYSFLSPETLTLVRLPENPYDIYAVSWGNIAPSSNVLIGIDNLNNNEALKKYISTPKITYVENWWKQFSGLTGVESLTIFTNKNGLKGYKVKYGKANGPVGYDDVFFEVESEPHIVIHVSNLVLDNTVFDRIVDSIAWNDN
jgi:hypothetical protein